MAPNNVSDVELIKERLPKIKSNTGCKKLYVDGGYYSQETANGKKEHGVDVNFTDMTEKEPKDKIAACEFKIDDETNTINSCPNGKKPKHTAGKDGQIVAHFPLEACSCCELLGQCPVKKQKKSYVVRFSQKMLIASSSLK